MGTSGGARAGERAVTEVEPPGRGQDGDGNYLAVCHARHPADNGLRLGTGRYEDRLRRVDGQWQWRIARRHNHGLDRPRGCGGGRGVSLTPARLLLPNGATMAAVL